MLCGQVIFCFIEGEYLQLLYLNIYKLLLAADVLQLVNMIMNFPMG